MSRHWPRARRRHLGAAAYLALLVAALPRPGLLRAAPPRAAAAAVTAAPQPSPVGAAVARLTAGGAPLAGYPDADWARVRRLYAARAHAPLWVDLARPAAPLTPRGAALVEALADAPAQALRLDASPWADLRAALDALGGASGGAPPAEALARADVLLTAAFVAYAGDLLTGQVAPRAVTREWHIDPQAADVDAALARTLAAADGPAFADALARLRPQDPDYAALTGALARYRALAARGGWAPLPATGVLHPGDTAAVGPLGALAARLRADGAAHAAGGSTDGLGDGPGNAGGAVEGARAVYDAALAGAVAEYQRRHGLVVDSILGPATRAALDRPAEYRLRQIAANLERHRWLPRARGDRYVIVNIPAFRLRAYDGGREVLAMNVVVGAEYGGRSTPVFSDSMAYVVFRPYWNVPSGIAARELWPRQRRDRSYFRRNGYEVARASWGRYVRQRPGPGNALGFVKFIFPNDFAIYLHDTPARHLFGEDVRAFSHGCIRVERPDALAEYVLGPQGWDLARVRRAMDAGENDTRVYLTRKLPVYIAYFTTYTRGGALHFANDVYDRDDALVRAVRGAALPPAALTREADAVRRAARALSAGI